MPTFKPSPPGSPRPRESKGLPDAPRRLNGETSTVHPAPGTPPQAWAGPGPAAAGYDSETDEPPQSFYEGMMRDRDRKRTRNPLERKKKREQARLGWQPFAKDPEYFVRDRSHAFDQGGPYCESVAFVFLALRHMGYGIKPALRIMRNTGMRSFVREQQGLGDKLFEAPAGHGDSHLATVNLTRILGLLRERAATFRESLSGTSAVRQQIALDKPDILSFSPIGYFSPAPTVTDEEMAPDFDIDLTVGFSRVVNFPHLPSGRRGTTFQASLFSSFQETVERTIPHPGKPDMSAYRGATPFVVLSLHFFSSRGKETGHCLIVDFSDPDHPGVFDPNFGWMEPRQGFNFLSLEQALETLWTYYTVVGPEPAQRGIRFHHGDNVRIHARAFQIYRQSAVSQLIEKKPTRRG